MKNATICVCHHPYIHTKLSRVGWMGGKNMKLFLRELCSKESLQFHAIFCNEYCKSALLLLFNSKGWKILGGPASELPVRLFNRWVPCLFDRTKVLFSAQ